MRYATSRRPLAAIGGFGITNLQQQHPFMVAWWSAVFPGFGHYLLNQYIRGTLLTLSEVIINTLARINEAMVFTFCGRFELAKATLEPRWMLGYLLIYLIAIGDSYRSAVWQNKLCSVAEHENEPLPGTRIGVSEVIYLERKSPRAALFYSFCFPGFGQLYNHRFALGFFGMFWWWVYAAGSRVYESITHLLLGHGSYANAILHPHWLLFLPSVMGGSMYHAHRSAREQNRLYRLEQRQLLAERFAAAKVRIFS